jgi:hypothetical protein
VSRAGLRGWAITGIPRYPGYKTPNNPHMGGEPSSNGANVTTSDTIPCVGVAVHHLDVLLGTSDPRTYNF